jgi:hypothetical protein
MHEQGYANVNAFPDGDVLVLVDPHHVRTMNREHSERLNDRERPKQ